MRTIEFIGVRGGHGTTTIALAVAATFAAGGPTDIAAHDPDALCVAVGTVFDGLPVQLVEGVYLKPDAPGVQVVDAGTLEQFLDLGPFDDEPSQAVLCAQERLRIGVLRGPDYVGLRTLCAHQEAQLDGIVVVSEAGRALDHRDVEHVTGRAVVAVVEHTPVVARAIDAGLLLRRCTRLREFAQLRSWLAAIAPEEAPCSAHA